MKQVKKRINKFEDKFSEFSRLIHAYRTISSSLFKLKNNTNNLELNIIKTELNACEIRVHKLIKEIKKLHPKSYEFKYNMHILKYEINVFSIQLARYFEVQHAETLNSIFNKMNIDEDKR